MGSAQHCRRALDFLSEAKRIFDVHSRTIKPMVISKMPTLAAFAYRHSIGCPIRTPNNDLSYTGNFLTCCSR